MLPTPVQMAVLQKNSIKRSKQGITVLANSTRDQVLMIWSASKQRAQSLAKLARGHRSRHAPIVRAGEAISLVRVREEGVGYCVLHTCSCILSLSAIPRAHLRAQEKRSPTDNLKLPV